MQAHSPEPAENEEAGPHEIAVIGDIGDNEQDIVEKLLAVPEQGECTLFFDSPGGSAYSAMSVMTLMIYRRLQATAVVTGECSSAALWPFAACQRRIVTPFSYFLFHPLRWQSEENVQVVEAAEWARHFSELDDAMTHMISEHLQLSPQQLRDWIHPGRYVTGPELVALGAAELFDPRARI